MTVTVSGSRVARDELEREVWRLTGWRGEATLVDQLLAAADRYALAVGRRLAEADVVVTTLPVSEPPPVAPSVVASVVAVPLAAGTLICRGCERTLDVGEFSRDSSSKNGRRRRCKRCEREARELARQARLDACG